MVIEDGPEIASLETAFSVQRRAFEIDRMPDAATRRDRLGALIDMMMSGRARIRDAMHADFGFHPEPATDLTEVLGVVARAQYVIENLEQWMRPEDRPFDEAVFGTAKAYVQMQPKGVVGNMVPWNFPFDIAVGPMIDMLAAGNRVILKPSEFTPACGELLREMVACAFDPDLVTVVTGSLGLSTHFAAMPWDHLLYTGSAEVGRKVMAAAAANLTPITLELGGKCPAILTPGSVNATNVEAVLGAKMVKNGQMCVSVDYCLVHANEIDRFVEQARSFVASTAPAYARSAECTGIISAAHVTRLEALLDEAERRGVSLVPTEDGGAADPKTRRMPITLAVDPPEDLAMMREEIFGPILPIVPYRDVGEAIARVNAGERPLGLYVFGDDEATNRQVLAATSSGGAAINLCALQSALPSMGFGGVGASGMGRHHGIEGFREFSNPRGVLERGESDMTSIFYPPYAKAAAVLPPL